jgi:manganese/iron transport system permease protein
MADLYHLLADPLRYPFMIHGLVAVLMVGVVCAVVGTFVVLRGLTFLGDALAHAILPGVAVGYLVHGGARGPLFWWALGTASLTSFGVGLLSRRGAIREDAAIGVVFSGMLALGIALISTLRNYAVDLTHLLFGNVLAVGPDDLLRIGLLGGLVVILLLAFYKELVVLAFDPILAATLRLPVRFLHYLLLFLMAVSVVVALQTVGIGLMMALLVTPPATALLISRRVGRVMVLAALLSASAGVIGLYLSYYFGLAPGAAVVLVCTAFFLIVLVATAGRRRRRA